MFSLASISSGDLAVLALLFGLLLAQPLGADELNVLGNFVVAVGGIMLTLAAQNQYLKSKAEEKKPDTESVLEELKNQVTELEKKIKAIEA